MAKKKSSTKRDRSGEVVHSVDRDHDWKTLHASVRCNVIGCDMSPKFAKPFCLAHICNMPYVQSILPGIASDYASDDHAARRNYIRSLKRREAANAVEA